MRQDHRHPQDTRQGFLDAQSAVLARYGIEAERRWIDIDATGGRAQVVVAGDGPPVVMCNGIGVPAAMMAPLIAGVANATVHAVDLPGYGLTDTCDDFYRNVRGSAVQFLVEVLDGLGLARPAIVANSLGSLWSTWLATDRPDRVAALAHVGCQALVLGTSAPLPMRLLGLWGLGTLMMRLQPPSARQVKQLSKMVHEHPLPPDIARLILATERLDHFESAFLRVLQQAVRLRGARPAWATTAADLARIDAPTLLVYARDDPMGGPAVGERVAAALPCAELHIVDGGHAPWIHHADQILPALNDFLARAHPTP